ncbi:MAG TPA: hemerythrin domain-containing protein [Pyrinomonadaceae bacterium]|nr:hemerythrin domain-containing protein [Pyrinomonadaceae bacterium]
MTHVSEQLIDDHAALDKVLKQLQAALRSNDLEVAHTKLDLFWARLAVHIRAEHLHLFPAVLSSRETTNASAPSPDEAQMVVSELRRDHDFFMHELARAIEITRELLTAAERSIREEGLNNVKNIVLEVERRLLNHNEIEENQLYRWATTLLNPEEQATLANQVTAELRKHPQRFTPSTWLDE